MNRMTLLIGTILLSAATAFAQTPPTESKVEEYNTVREFKNRVFTLENREAGTIAAAVKLLGSGFRGAGLNVNEQLRTITVRDFPENIAAIDEAIKRLDRPAIAPDVELNIAVLIGSKTPLPGASVPEELSGVVKQLQTTLKHPHYGLMTTTMHRTKTGNGIEGSGVAEATLLGMTADQGRPIIYNYKLRGITHGTGEQSMIDIGNFQFGMRIPLDLGGGSVQYQAVGFETPVSVRQREKVVIGTTTMRDKVLIVVVTANVN